MFWNFYKQSYFPWPDISNIHFEVAEFGQTSKNSDTKKKEHTQKNHCTVSLKRSPALESRVSCALLSFPLAPEIPACFIMTPGNVCALTGSVFACFSWFCTLVVLGLIAYQCSHIKDSVLTRYSKSRLIRGKVRHRGSNLGFQLVFPEIL